MNSRMLHKPEAPAKRGRRRSRPRGRVNWGLASQGVRPTVAVVGRGPWPVGPWCSMPVAKLGPRGCGPFIGDSPSAPGRE
jgi:hypothetical protein